MHIACNSHRSTKRRNQVVGPIVVSAAVALIAAGMYPEQTTAQVILGGSGEPGVEIDFGALNDPGYGPPVGRGGRMLRMPGSSTKPGAHIVLRPPRGIILQQPGMTGNSAVKRLTLRRPDSIKLRPPANMATEALPQRQTAGRAGADDKPKPSIPAKRRSAKTAPEKTAEPKRLATATPRETTSPPSLPEALKAEIPKAPPPPVVAPKATDNPPTPPRKATETEAANTPPPPPDMSAVTKAPDTPTRTAALTSPSTPVPSSKQTRIIFSAGSATLPGSAKSDLTDLAATASKDADLRVQVLAYASGDGDSASQARRLSLSRALAIRSYLIEQGVRSTRIDVRALGNKTDVEPADRVDLILANR